MIRVYIAGPYTNGDQAVNVRKSIDMAEEVIKRGCAPIVPLYFHFQHMIYPHPYEIWTNIDIELLGAADCLIRIPGESKGADYEVLAATERYKPVFFSLSEFDTYYMI